MSRCGKKFHPEKVGKRPGWEHVNAVLNNEIYEIKSAYILQPGPAALSDGLDQLFTIMQKTFTMNLFCSKTRRNRAQKRFIA